MKTRTRFAPSPTGYLHIGGIRTALYAFALAHHKEGDYILRVEDTDRNRYDKDGEDAIYTVLDDYGLTPDESDRHGGEFGPYTQSKRLDLYQEHAHQLVQKGFAYYCFLSSEETKQLQEQFIKENKRFRSPFREHDLNESKKFIAEGKKYTVRLKVPLSREMEYEDGLQGHMRFNTDDIDDSVLLKQDGFPTYHLAVVIDDHFMKITDIFRGVEWISSIPKHLLIHEGFGWEMPTTYHLPVIKDPEGGKLSKRKGNTAASEFLEEGYLPAAINNFLMLLGWSSPEEREHGEAENEIFSLERFVELFDPKDLNKSNPIFNREKLLWFNKQYIKSTNIEELKKYMFHWIEKYHADHELYSAINSDPHFEDKIVLIQERSSTLLEMLDSLKFFYERPKDIDWEIKQVKRVKGKITELKKEIHDLIETFDDDSTKWEHMDWEEGMRKIGDAHEVKHGDIFMVNRMAVVGSPFSPPLFESQQILGKDEVLKRLK